MRAGMDGLISEFAAYLQFERRRSPHTVASYRIDLQLFRDYAKTVDAEITWQSVDADIIRGWMEDMMDKGRSATSINRRLSSLRSFFRFAVMRGKVASDPAFHVRGPKKARPLPQYLQEQEMDRLLGDDYWTDSFADLRARTIILTFYSTGIRLSELTGLDDADIDFANGALKVLGKRNKERVIPFGDELSNALKTYIARRNEAVGQTKALFVTDRGGRMKDWQVRNLVRTHVARVSTMKKRSPHILRHSFATAMLNNDAALESIKELLGHESASTTEIYTHTTFEQLRKVYNQSHPRGNDAADDA